MIYTEEQIHSLYSDDHSINYWDYLYCHHLLIGKTVAEAKALADVSSDDGQSEYGRIIANHILESLGIDTSPAWKKWLPMGAAVVGTLIALVFLMNRGSKRE